MDVPDDDDEEYEERYLEVTSLARGRRETAALSLSDGVRGRRDGFGGGGLFGLVEAAILFRPLWEVRAVASMSSDEISVLALSPLS